MNILPPELHSYIFQLACTDNGQTIRTLNSVSSYFHEISKPFLYHTVSVSGTEQIEALIQRIENIPHHHRLIRHLYLSDSILEKSKSVNIQAINRLLIFAAPHLHSLAFIIASPFQSTALISRLFRTSFPYLVDLTISGFYSFPSSADKFPRLQTLHLHGNTNPVGLFETNCLTKSCPVLRSLHISGLKVAGPFVMELHEALKGKAHSESDKGVVMSDIPPVELPKSIQHIVVQAGMTGDGISPSATLARLKHTVMMERLEEVESSSVPNIGGVTFTIKGSGDVTPLDIHRSWLERL